MHATLHRSALTLATLCLSAAAVGAEPELDRGPALSTPSTVLARPPVEVEAVFDFGVVRAPYFAPAFSEVRAHGVVLALSGRHWLSPTWQLGVRLPVALISIRQPAGAFVDEGALGNPSLFLRRELELASSMAKITGWAGGAIGVPLAEHGDSESLLESRALEAANAIEAYRWPEAFSPGTLPIVPRAGARLEAGHWKASAELRLPVLVRLTEPSPSNQTDTHGLGFLPGLELSASAQPARIVCLSLAADASLAVARVFEPARPAARFQPSLSPSVQLHFERFELEFAFRAPLGGALGGSTFAGGLALRVH